MKKIKSLNIIKLAKGEDFTIYFLSILIGIITGITMVLYRFFIKYISNIRISAYEYYKETNSQIFLILWLIIIFIIALILGIIDSKLPLIRGSGIPHLKGFLIRQFNFKWWRELLGKLFGNTLALGSGLALGRTAPFIGAQIGDGVFSIFKRHDLERKYLVSCGASAGLSASLNVPLTSVLFIIEEFYKFISPVIIASVLTASVIGDYISRSIFGLNPIFNIKNTVVFPLKYYWITLILAIIVTLLGKFFNFIALKFMDLYDNLMIPNMFKPIIPIFTAFILGFFIIELTLSGDFFIDQLVSINLSIKMLLLFLVIKFLFTIICYGSRIPGGLFLPVLAIGGIAGKIYALVLINYFGFSEVYTAYFIVMGMASFFTAVIKTPITGVILVLETTGSFDNLFPVIVVVMFSFLLSEFVKTKSIYNLLLNRLLENHEVESDEDEDKTVLEFPVSPDSILEEKSINSVSWPRKCLIITIKRNGIEIIPEGNTRILPGDILVILTTKAESSFITNELNKLV